MPILSAVVPTLDRPMLVQQAIRSLVEQTRPLDEIIVVDDGSRMPIDAADLRCRFGERVRVVRHATPRGLAYARNHGVEVARGDILIHLDDDDLLAPETLEEASALLEGPDATELVFLNVEGFGPHCGHYNRRQPEVLERVIRIAGGRRERDHVVAFGTDLFAALLRSVPAAFQHVVVRREAWLRASNLRCSAYQLAPDQPDFEEARRRLTGPLRDSEWALYAALSCQRMVLLDRPYYRFRCEGQNYASRSENRYRHLEQGLSIKRQMHRAAQWLPPLAAHADRIRRSLSDGEFDLAYALAQSGSHGGAWRHLRRAVEMTPQFKHFRLAARLCLGGASRTDDPQPLVRPD